MYDLRDEKDLQAIFASQTLSPYREETEVAVGISELVEYFHGQWDDHVGECNDCYISTLVFDWPECEKHFCEEWKEKWREWDEAMEDC